MRGKLVAVAVAVAMTAGIVASEAPASAGSSTIGSSGVGDPFFPLAGNGGYDVQHYDLTMAWDPAKGKLDATADIQAKATQDLDRFDLDLRGFDVSSVTVNGRPATTKRNGQELIISPAREVRRGTPMDIVVTYAGKPGLVTDPDGSSEGWMPTSDGIVALGEPQGSPAWFPANDHPTDKATFELTMTVPNGWTVVSNGQPDQPRTSNGATTFRWHEDDPMATYLATVAIGHFKLQTSRTSSGLPVINAIEPSLAADAKASVARIPEMVDWLSGIFGRYPFSSTGAIVVDAPAVGYALETQTRPVFTWAPDDFTVVHELAHQWVGDSVSLSTWPDIWLNEGFAAYTEWLWSEHEGGDSADKIFRRTYNSTPAGDALWKEPPAALPNAAELFSDSSYTRGAMTLHALRLAVGDPTFFKILKTWTTTNRNGNVTTKDFIKLAEQLSHKNLKPLFNAWLYTPKKPSL